jgi:quinol monooxygenase YgiN
MSRSPSALRRAPQFRRAAWSPSPTSTSFISHVDVIPPKKDDGIAALKALAEPTRKDTGNLRYDAYQQKTRPNHFTVIEVWRDQKAVDAHETDTHTKDFRKVLGSATGALYDQRWYKAL